MLPVDTFTLITGLASVFGFAIQTFDFFPRLGRSRQFIFALLLGIFIGSLLRAVEPTSIKLNIEATGYAVLVTLFVVVIVSFLIAGAFTEEPRKRGELFGISGIGFLAFLVFSFFGAMMSGAVEMPATEKQRLTIHELSVLSDNALSNNDHERAVMHLQTIKERLKDDEARTKLVKERIRAIEIEAVK